MVSYICIIMQHMLLPVEEPTYEETKQLSPALVTEITFDKVREESTVPEHTKREESKVIDEEPEATEVSDEVKIKWQTKAGQIKAQLKNALK